MSDILIVEDESVLARSIVSFLERRGFSAIHALDATTARMLFNRDRPRLVILDYKLNMDDGLELLHWFRNADPLVRVVMMTGHGDVDLAVRAMKSGAQDFLVKPTPLSCIASIATELMLDEMQGGLDRKGVDRIIGRSSAANALRGTLRKLAKAPDGCPNVLIMGPAGTGKTLCAKALHETAAPDAPLVEFDCTVDGREALQGALTEARAATLVLRHVSDLPVEDQRLLLRHLQQQEPPAIVIATSERHLTPGEHFLPDLLYRIQVGWIDVPALSDRAADVLPIADYFARRLARDRGEPRVRFSSAARAKLLEHDWPGNVAELENCIARAMLLQNGGEIQADDIRAIGETDSNDIPTLKEMELGAITKALSRTDGNVSRAAELLGISRDTLRYRMEKFELSRR